MQLQDNPVRGLALAFLLAAGGAVADGQTASPEELAAARAEVEQAREALMEATRALQALSGNEADRIVSVHREVREHRSRPVIGIVMDEPRSGDGVQLSAVTPGGPASKAGIRSGDRLLAINGSRLDSGQPVGQAMELLEGMAVGDEYELLVRRGNDTELAVGVIAEAHTPTMVFDLQTSIEPLIVGGQNFKFNVKELQSELERVREGLHVRIPEVNVSGSGDINFWRFGFGWSGLELARVNPDLGRYFGVEEGALVVDVDESIEGDLLAGDVILSVQGRSVAEPGEVMRELRRYDAGETVSVEVARDGRTIDVDVTAPQPVGNAFFYEFESGEDE